MKNKTKGLLLRLPVTILFLIITGASFYLKFTNYPINNKPLSWFTPLFITLIFILYLWGEYKSFNSSERDF